MVSTPVPHCSLHTVVLLLTAPHAVDVDCCCLPASDCRQFHRVYERWTRPSEEPLSHHYGRRDARDNNWLLLECVLALPLALGLWTTPVSLALACGLLGEAVVHWQWWAADIPTWVYRQGVRDQFFVNTAVAGGLALMQSFGGGALSVDELLQMQKQQ